MGPFGTRSSTVRRRLSAEHRARRGLITACLVTAVFGVLLANPDLAAANHIKGAYPNQGFLWMSKDKNYSGAVWATSTRCNQSESDAWELVRSSTVNKVEMRRWTNGIQMRTERCDGLFMMNVDFKINYLPQALFRQRSGRFIGGRNIDAPATADFCLFWSVPAGRRCGNRPEVQINQDKFFSNPPPSNYQKRELMHESGHSHGFNGNPHHCNSRSINNDGSSGCSYDWLNTLSYQSTDRIGINTIYP